MLCWRRGSGTVRWVKHELQAGAIDPRKLKELLDKEFPGQDRVDVCYAMLPLKQGEHQINIWTRPYMKLSS